MKFSETHEWVSLQGDRATVGITDYAQKELGEIVYVELPEVGQLVKAREEAAVLESTKAAADVYAPISGTVVAVNGSLSEQPGLVNRSAEKEGWLFQVVVSDPSELEELLDRPANSI